MYTTRVVNSRLCWCRSWVETRPPANEVSHCNIPGVWLFWLACKYRILFMVYEAVTALSTSPLWSIVGSHKSKWKYLFPDTIWLHVAFFSSHLIACANHPNLTIVAILIIKQPSITDESSDEKIFIPLVYWLVRRGRLWRRVMYESDGWRCFDCCCGHKLRNNEMVYSLDRRQIADCLILW